MAVCLLAGNRLSLAQDQDAGDQNYSSTTTGTAAPATTPLDQPPGLAPTPAGPAPLAPNSPMTPQPLETVIPNDASGKPKFYTITAALREEYDDNIYTTKDNKTGSFVTEFTPSILMNFPERDSDFAFRYTFGLDYYYNRHGDPLNYTHEALFRYTHNFGDRFNLDVRDQVGYYYEPNLLAGVGSPYEDGNYYANTFSAVLNAQWTPTFGTTTSYSNMAVLYTNDAIATYQNSDENTLDQDFRFAFAPKFNFVFGAIFDDIDYFDFDRGYTSYTGDVGIDWQTLPTLTMGFRIGGTVTTSSALPTTTTPYAAFNIDWQLGARSELIFGYLHDVVPTDVVDAIGQVADRFSLRFNYDITPRLVVHAQGILTYSDYTQGMLTGGLSSFTEVDSGVDVGAEYHWTPNLSFEAGYFLSDISSEESYRDYTRNQVYVGVRGTY